MKGLLTAGAGLLGALAVLAPTSVLAWGATGHRIIGALGVSTLPRDLPAFLLTPEAALDIGELAREPDRWRGAGRVHDTTRDPAHFVNVDDSGKVLGGPALNALPATRADYETALRAVGSNSAKAGYLPYAIIDGWQQLAKDFTYWRILQAAIPRETIAARKAWMQRDLVRREARTIDDLGVWAHYVGDGSQPMHVSVHYNGWGAYPNPHGYTQDHVHVPWEGGYVYRKVTLDSVEAALTPARVCEDSINLCVARYLSETAAAVDTFYAMQKAGDFSANNEEGRVFTTNRVAAGASALRDLVTMAWRASASGSIGFPALSVDQVVKGRLDPFDVLYGDD